MKNVWIPNIKIPTTPLNKATSLAPFIPIEVRNITGKGKPYFWEGLLIKFEKKYVSKHAITEPKKTIKISKLGVY